MNRKAVIVGSAGQDGQLLWEYLSQLGYTISKIDRYNLDITCAEEVGRFVKNVMPDEIYFLAAWHHSAEDTPERDDVLFQNSLDIHVRAVSIFLESICKYVPSCRFFYASSSHIFPGDEKLPQDEYTKPEPDSVYAITKYTGMMTCRYYREHRDVYASCGILYNHESNLRQPGFLSRKVAIAAAKIALNNTGKIKLGNLEAKVDWGYAPDYVNAMHRILQQDTPTDYVIATGQAHTVRELVEIAFKHVGLDFREYVTLEQELLIKPQVTRIGNPARLMHDTGWKPSMDFRAMVKKMVDTELERLRGSGEGANSRI